MPPNKWDSFEAAAVHDWEEKFRLAFSSNIAGETAIVKKAMVACECDVRADGSLYNVRIKDSSGQKSVDKVLLTAIRICNVPNPPSSYVKSGFVFIVNNRLGQHMRLAPRFSKSQKNIGRFT